MALAHVTLADPRARAVNGLLPRGPGLDADRAAAEQRGARRLAANRARAGAAPGRGPRVPALAVRARVRPAHRAEPSAPEFPTLKARLIAHGAEVIEPLRDTPFDRFFFGDSNGYLFEVLEQEQGAENLVR